MRVVKIIAIFFAIVALLCIGRGHWQHAATLFMAVGAYLTAMYNQAREEENNGR